MRTDIHHVKTCDNKNIIQYLEEQITEPVEYKEVRLNE